MNLVHARPEHIEQVGATLQPGGGRAACDLDALNRPPNEAYAVLGGDGRAVAIGGLIHLVGARWYAWARISNAARTREIAGLLRFAREVLSVRYGDRVECHIDVGFAAGERFARRLGFERECVARRIGEDGLDKIQMARLL